MGWYHTGPKLHRNDIAIDEFIKRYCPNSVSETSIAISEFTGMFVSWLQVLVIVDAQPKEVGLPTDAYIAVEEIHDVC